MDLSLLSFLAHPWFVLPWFGFGLWVAIWLVYDEYWINPSVQPPLKVGRIILAPFLSILTLLMYLWTCRPPGIQGKQGEEAQQLHHKYVITPLRRTTGAVIHCVAGDGLGIVTAMIIARTIGLEFWPEFIFEYLTGYALGWLIFQTWAMRHMGNSWGKALYMGGRAEFFSMLTVMYGMGLVMRFITPAVMPHRPKPDELAFWGFAALGLFVGALFTYPMNWWPVRIGWKHGMS